MADRIVLDRESFKALAADTRVAMLKKLAKKPMTGAELSEETGLSPSTVKEHLDQLEKAGLIVPSKGDGEKRKWKYLELSEKGRRIIQPSSSPLQVLLALSVVFLGLVFVIQMISFQSSFSLSPLPQQPLQYASPEGFAQSQAQDKISESGNREPEFLAQKAEGNFDENANATNSSLFTPVPVNAS